MQLNRESTGIEVAKELWQGQAGFWVIEDRGEGEEGVAQGLKSSPLVHMLIRGTVQL